MNCGRINGVGDRKKAAINSIKKLVMGGATGLPYLGRVMRLVFCVSMVVMASDMAYAASAVDIERSLQESQRLIQEHLQREELRQQGIEERVRKPSGETLKPVERAVMPTDGRCFKVERVVIDGATKLPERMREEILQPVLGQCVNLVQINRILERITNYYVEHGYTTTRVYLPEQDLTNGELRLLVLEGRVDQIMLEGSGVSLEAAFPGLLGGIFNLRDFEQGIDQINRLQSNSATIDIAPSDKPGASVVIIRNTPRKRWTVNLAADNTGSDSTGYVQTSASMGYENLLGLNDYLNFSVRANPDMEPDRKMSRSVSGVMVIPYGYWTLSANVSDFSYASIVQGSVASFQSSGSSSASSMKLGRVLLRDQRMKWSLSGTLTSKESLNYLNKELIQTGSRKLSVFDAGSNVSLNALGGIWGFDVGMSRGLAMFGALQDADGLPSAAPRAQFTKYTYGANVMRPFEVDGVKFSFQSALTGQSAQDVLYGTEQILIGGPYSVRGFRRYNISGDSGLNLRNDLSMSMPLSQWLGESAPPNGQIKPYVAYDIGQIQGKYGLPGGAMSGATLGVLVTAGSASLHIAYSRALSMPESLGVGDQYGFVRLAFDF